MEEQINIEKIKKSSNILLEDTMKMKEIQESIKKEYNNLFNIPFSGNDDVFFEIFQRFESFQNDINKYFEFLNMTNNFFRNYLTSYVIKSKAESENILGKNGTKKIDDINIGTVIDGKYELLKFVGQGGMMKVYLAIDKRISKLWAVKICRDDLHNNSDIAKNMMLQETEMIKNLDHPAIPRIVDIINIAEYFVIVQDYVEGTTLENIVKNYGAQPVARVVDWAKQICDVLGYLHSQNPPHIYRDMKPSNVILQPNGNIKIVDFGLMRTYKPNQLEDTCNLGTLGYAAPDHFGGNGQTDPRSDVYTIGVTMHRLLTAYDPTKSPHEIPPIRKINSDLPESMEYIISKCTELDRNNRYQTCVELLNDLNRYEQLPPKKSFFNKIFKH